MAAAANSSPMCLVYGDVEDVDGGRVGASMALRGAGENAGPKLYKHQTNNAAETSAMRKSKVFLRIWA